jgi:glycogen(starch) synthase
MKVLHICQRDDPGTGGAVRVAVELARHFPGLGVESKLIFAYGGPGPFAKEMPAQCLYLGSGEPLSAIRASLRLRRLLRDEKPDIIHHHDGLTWTYLVTRVSRNAPLITHGHLTAPSTLARWRDRISGAIHRTFAERIIAVSAYVATSWENAGCPKERIQIIPNAVDADLFRPPSGDEKCRIRERFDLPKGARVICFVGRLHNEVKRCDDFLKTIALLPESYWGLIAGSGPDEANLKKLATQLNIAHRIRFVGFIDPPLSCYQASDLFLMTSSYEPFGMVVLEAAACGLPVVGLSADGGVDELVREMNGQVVNRANLPRVAELIDQTLTERIPRIDGNPPSRSSASPRDCASRYSWAITTQKTKFVYDNICQQSLGHEATKVRAYPAKDSSE